MEATSTDCPTCGAELVKPNDSSPAICRKCAVNQLLLAPAAEEPTKVESEDFELLEEIGRGGEGTVYLGFDKKFNRKVAVKIIKSLNDLDKSSVLRFKAEAQAIAALDHPHIIPIYASGEMRGRPYFTMKYVNGGSLQDKLELFSEPREAAQLMAAISGAIHHAHTRGILHRDIKPSNILLSEDKKPYVTDFGLAKSKESNSDMTIVGMIVGTPAYMSPEQARGDTLEISTRSDVFSLGSIFYQLLTGEQAFKGDSSQSTINEVIEKEIEFPAETNAFVDRDLQMICLKALQKNPEQRYSSALAMRYDLQLWLEGRPVSARPISNTEKTVRAAQRNPGLTAAIATAIALMLLGGAIITSLYVTAESARKRSEAARIEAEENNYFATVSSALGARERSDFGDAQRQLQLSPAEKRTFDWRLVQGLSQGDQVWTSSFGTTGKHVRLSYNSADENYVLLGPGTQLRSVDSLTGDLRSEGVVPQPTKSVLRDFQYSPSGQNYFYTDEEMLYVAASGSNQLLRSVELPVLATAVWLDNRRILYASAPISAAQPTLPRDSAVIYDLVANTSTPLPVVDEWSGPVARSTDGSRIALMRMGEEIVVFASETFDFSTSPLVTIPVSTPVQDIALQADGRYLGVLSGEKSSDARVYDLTSGESIFQQTWPSPARISFCPQTSHFILAGEESWLTRWDFLHAAQEDHAFDDGYDDAIPHARFGPFTPPLNLLTRSAGRGRCTFYFGHYAPVMDVTHLADENAFISISLDGTLRKWSNTLPSTFALRRDNADTTVHLPAASANGEHIAYQNLSGVPEVWHRSAALSSVFPKGHSHLVSLNDGRVLTLLEAGVYCWQTHLGYDPDPVWEILPTQEMTTTSTVLSAALTPDESIAAVLLHGELLIIDIQEQSMRRILIPRGKPGVSASHQLSVSPNGQMIALSGSQGYYTSIFRHEKTSDRYVFHQLEAPEGRSSLDTTNIFNHDGSQLYVGHKDGWVHVYDLSDFANLEEKSQLAWQAHSFQITALALSQKGDILSTSAGQSTTLWSTEVQAGKPRRERLRLKTGTSSRNWVKFAADDTVLLHTAPRRPIEAWIAPVDPS